MKILGLTGPSGGGKGVVGNAFLTREIPVLDTDAVYHDLIARSSPCTEELAAAFGHEILTPDGAVDRQRLAAIVFSGGGEKSERLALLNRITHRYVIASCDTWLETQAHEGKRAAVIDAPLLIEAELHKKCDHVIAVLAPMEMRLSRIMARDCLSYDAAKARISAQKPDAFYEEHADFVFLNDKGLAQAETFVNGVIAKLSLLQ